MMEIDLRKIGFEYGRCKREGIVGDISWFELEYTQVNGVQRIRFEDQAQTFDLGFSILGQAKVVKRFEFDASKRWVGIHGLESDTGIEKIGIITMDPTCKPIGAKEEEPIVVEDETDESETVNEEVDDEVVVEEEENSESETVNEEVKEDVIVEEDDNSESETVTEDVIVEKDETSEPETVIEEPDKEQPEIEDEEGTVEP